MLIQAVGGGVGHTAVQIAKAFGAEVLATASTSKVDLLHSLGADEVIDFTRSDFSTIGLVISAPPAATVAAATVSP